MTIPVSATLNDLQNRYPASAHAFETAQIGGSYFRSDGFVWSPFTSSDAVLGPYATLAALQDAAPAAGQAGKQALVGAGAPYAIYDSNGAAWVLDGSDGGGSPTPLANNMTTSTPGVSALDAAQGPVIRGITDGLAAAVGSKADAAATAASLAQLAPIANPIFTGTPAAPTTASNDNSTRLATTAMVQAALAAVTAGLLDLKSSLDASISPTYPPALKGDTYFISVAGKVGGALGKAVEVGDIIVASADNAGGNEAAVGTSWFAMEHNLVGTLLVANNLSDLSNSATARTNLGLGLVNNTSDANKPVSTAQAAAIASAIAQFPTARLAHCVTRCYLPNTTNASVTYAMGRSSHFARSKLVGVSAVYGNWRMNGTTETTTGAANLKVSLEYPIGGTRVLSDQCIAAGNTSVSFPVGNQTHTWAGITIPKGAKYALYPYVTNASGVVWGAHQSIYVGDPNDGVDLGTGSGTDKTITGTVGTAGQVYYTPIAMGSMTTDPSMLIFGTSRELGGAPGSLDQLYDAGITAPTIGPVYGYTNCAVAATTLANWNSGTHTYLNALIAAGWWTHATNEYGCNDFAAGDSAATLVTRRALFATNLKAQKSDIVLIGQTLLPYNSSTDAWTSTGNQSASASNQVKVTAFNPLCRAGIAGEDFYFDISDAVDPFRTDKWPISRNPNDTTRAQATFTASVAGMVLTVTAVASGTIAVGENITDSLTALGAIVESTQIISAGTGTGGTGTYNLNHNFNGTYPNPSAISSRTMYTGDWGTYDGLHPTQNTMSLIMGSGKIKLDFMRR